MSVIKTVNVERLQADIESLSVNVQQQEVAPLLAVLKSLAQDPENDALLKEMVDTFNGLGFEQGLVLTHAPYIKVMLSDHIDTLMSHDPYWNKVWEDEQ